MKSLQYLLSFFIKRENDVQKWHDLLLIIIIFIQLQRIYS
jgi:hypothetical protein